MNWRLQERVMDMFKSLLSGTCLLALMAGCASAPQKPVASADARPKTCLTSGSRIPLSQNECAATGQSYTGEDLQQTGHVGDAAAALRQLDPVVH
jgi:hypothetical protein